MAFLQMQFFSKALNFNTSVWFLFPEDEIRAKHDTPPDVLYLLHGYHGDQSVWMRRTAIERYASDKNLAVIMPAANNSFYTNMKYGERYWDYIAFELPEIVHGVFRLSDKSESTHVAGLSMGGYGALKLALTFPERFATAGSFSGALDIKNVIQLDMALAERIYGDPQQIDGSDNDLKALMIKNSLSASKPKLYISCGTDDPLYGTHLSFLPAAEENGWSVSHFEVPGFDHSWPFWDREIQKYLVWAGIK